MKIVVIGGTGLIGSKLVKLLRDRDQEVLPASPDSSAPRRSSRVRATTACLVLAVTIDGLP